MKDKYVRIVANQNGEVEQVNHYYPYGDLMGESTNSDHQPYKYNGKELDRHHGLDWYDYGARRFKNITIIAPNGELEVKKDFDYEKNRPQKMVDGRSY